MNQCVTWPASVETDVTSRKALQETEVFPSAFISVSGSHGNRRYIVDVETAQFNRLKLMFHHSDRVWGWTSDTEIRRLCCKCAWLSVNGQNHHTVSVTWAEPVLSSHLHLFHSLDGIHLCFSVLGGMLIMTLNIKWHWNGIELRLRNIKHTYVNIIIICKTSISGKTANTHEALKLN